MEYVIIGIIAVVIAVGLAFYLKLKKDAPTVDSCEQQPMPETESIQVEPSDVEVQNLAIPVEELSIEDFGDKDKLVEITDSKVLAHINNLIPGFAQVGNVTNNALQAAQSNGEVLYRAIIPAGAKLSDSKAMEGAVRGIYHGANGIQGHANLVAVEAQNGAAIVANTAAAAMGVASMVVGQYYMTQINTQLGEIRGQISKISNFQDYEYRNKVRALMSDVARIASFQTEILENSEVRLSKIIQIDALEHECETLLGQACDNVSEFARLKNLDYAAYENKLPEIQNWYVYQEALLSILNKISELRYTLHLGTASKDFCSSSLPQYTGKVRESQAELSKWHNDMVNRLAIDITDERRKRVGFDRAMHFFQGLVNDDNNFRPIEKSTAKMIKTQSNGSTPKYDTSELYEEDVQLISKGGKIYYLPVETSNEEVKS